MPYRIDSSVDGCSYAVVTEGSGKVVGCHASRRAARRQLRALYANVPEASKTRSLWPFRRKQDAFAAAERMLIDTTFWDEYQATLIQDAQPMFEEIFFAGVKAALKLQTVKRAVGGAIEFDETQKHGSHDQSSHGRRRGGGGGGGGRGGEPTEPEIDALYWYGGSDRKRDRAEFTDYASLNRNLRQKKTLSDTEESLTENLDSVIQKSPLESSTVLYRGVDVDVFRDWEPGSNVIDNGFISMTTNKKTAEWFGTGSRGDFLGPGGQVLRNVRTVGTIEVLADKGTRAASLVKLTGASSVLDEHLLSRGTRFRVVSKTTDTSNDGIVNIHVVAEIVS